MNNSSPEQPLEWTFQRRWCVVDAVQFFLSLLVGILLVGLVFGAGAITFFIILFGLTLLLTVLLAWGKMPKRKLRINQQTTILTDTAILRIKERQMTTTGAKFCAVHFGFFERLFAFDYFQADSAYQIEITRNGETFLFPCEDETQQRQILQTIDAMFQALAERENV